ncbi:MAG TPA: TerC family protein [Candidatus Sulfotelmatobacter sp.]|nr:TerC family protein [Candidatus Sulfotelmatobacter sp.]
MFAFDPAAAAALVEVILIDIMLSGDNAIVIGLAVAGLPEAKRQRIIVLGVAAAAVMRLVLTLFALRLLMIVGLRLAGGILLLYVAWKMWREIRRPAALHGGAAPAEKTALQATLQIVFADLSMSLDNVLGVAGAAHQHPTVLMFGLALSVVLMTVAANLVARLLNRHRWLVYVGLAVVAFVAVQLIWEGGAQVWGVMGPA